VLRPSYAWLPLSRSGTALTRFLDVNAADQSLRSATGEEWAEFEQHFLLRKVALGDCHRPTAPPAFAHVHGRACCDG
jgi:hypothetical protein